MKRIMIIGVGWEQLPLISLAKEMDCYVIATTQWKKEKIRADIVYEVDSRNIEELEKIYLKELPDAVTADECDYSTYAVAYLTEKYNLPGPNLKTLMITNNKYLQRKILKDKEGIFVRQPEFFQCWNYEEAEAAAEKIGYPAIIKPVDNRGSIGVIKVNNIEELKKAWYKSVINAYSRMCIIEKYIEGDTVTAEGFFDSEKFNFITVSSKDTYKENKNVAKVLYYPGKITEEQIGKIKSYTKEIVKAYEIDFGFTHFEFLLEKGTGDVYFVEAANRGGGVFISNMILKEITKMNFAESLIRMALGNKVVLKPIEIQNKSIMYFFQPSGKMEIEHILEENRNTVVIHINPADEEDTFGKEDARQRKAVVILSGSNLNNLLLQAEKIEQNIASYSEETIYIKED